MRHSAACPPARPILLPINACVCHRPCPDAAPAAPRSLGLASHRQNTAASALDGASASPALSLLSSPTPLDLPPTTPASSTSSPTSLKFQLRSQDITETLIGGHLVCRWKMGLSSQFLQELNGNDGQCRDLINHHRHHDDDGALPTRDADVPNDGIAHPLQFHIPAAR